MKVRDLLPQEIDIDVCDDYDESCYIAFCGPMKLTAEGEAKFADALDVEIELHNDIVILVCGDDDKIARKNVKAVTKLFYSMAGYCLADDYDKWFIEEE